MNRQVVITPTMITIACDASKVDYVESIDKFFADAKGTVDFDPPREGEVFVFIEGQSCSMHKDGNQQECPYDKAFFEAILAKHSMCITERQKRIALKAQE